MAPHAHDCNDLQHNGWPLIGGRTSMVHCLLHNFWRALVRSRLGLNRGRDDFFWQQQRVVQLLVAMLRIDKAGRLVL